RPTGTGASLMNTTNATIEDVEFILEQDSIGLKNGGCNNISINNTIFKDIGPFAIGIESTATRDMIIKNSTFTIQNDGSKGVALEISSITLIKENIFDNSANISVSLSSISANGLNISQNYFTLTGEMATGMELVAGTGSQITNNQIIAKGLSSSGLVLLSETSMKIFQNLIYADGNRSTGGMFDASGLASGNVITTTGHMSTGAVTEGRNMTIRGGRFDVDGENSTGMMVLHSENLTVHEVEFSVDGKNGTAISSMGFGSTFTLSNLDLDLGSAGRNGLLIMDIGVVAKVNRCEIVSLSDEPALMLTGNEVLITNTNITADVGISAHDLNLGLILDTRITSWTSINATRSMIEVHGSDISSTLVAGEDSFIRSVDSIIRLVNVSETATLSVEYTMGIMLLDRNEDPFEGVEIELTLDDVQFYSTPRFGGDDPLTASDGKIPYFRVINRVYEGRNTPTFRTTALTVFSRGTADRWDGTYIIDTSYSHLVPFTSPDIDLPAQPTGFRIFTLELREAFLLNWERNQDDTTEYLIYWHNSSSSGWDVIGRTVNNSFETDDMGPGVTAYFKVSAWDGTWESEPSLPDLNTTLDLTPPGKVRNLVVGTTAEHTISLSWSMPTTEDLLEFIIEMNRSGSHSSFNEVLRVTGDQRGAVITGLLPGIEYSFRIYAIDESMNPSDMSDPISVTTQLPRVEIVVNVFYGMGGPMSGLTARNATVDLIDFNGTIIISSMASEEGVVTFTTIISQATQVRILSMAVELHRGEADFRSGYLDNITEFILLTGTSDDMVVNLTLHHYEVPGQGFVRVRVQYGEGPRTGYMVNAIVTLLDDSENVIETKLSDPEGEANFRVSVLPLRGYFIVEPPEILAGEDGERSGYLTGSSNFFELTVENPDWGYIDVYLPYYEYKPPPLDLEMIVFGPKGVDVPLITSIVISFNQPMDGESVRNSILFDPPLKNPEFVWSNGNMTLTIKHGGLIANTEYLISLTTGATSLEGTTFAPTALKGWSFTTVDVVDTEGGRTISNEMIMGIVGLIVLIFIIVAILFITRSNRRSYEEDPGPVDDEAIYEDEEYDDDYEDDAFYDEYSDEDEDGLPMEEEKFDEDLEEEEFGEEEEEELEELDQLEDDLDEDLDEEEERMLEEIEEQEMSDLEEGDTDGSGDPSNLRRGVDSDPEEEMMEEEQKPRKKKIKKKRK
ncbi:MAG: fibronectin type III domain-containing protein, partial [Thermoplasmata archaeon]|nr:fibronectin type III domain-containing protein [Thermoplasmata archaeon]